MQLRNKKLRIKIFNFVDLNIERDNMKKIYNYDQKCTCNNTKYYTMKINNKNKNICSSCNGEKQENKPFLNLWTNK